MRIESRIRKLSKKIHHGLRAILSQLPITCLWTQITCLSYVICLKKRRPIKNPSSYFGSILGSGGVTQFWDTNKHVYEYTPNVIRSRKRKRVKNETTTIGDTRWDKLPSTTKLSKSRNLIESLPGRQPNRNREQLCKIPIQVQYRPCWFQRRQTSGDGPLNQDALT